MLTIPLKNFFSVISVLHMPMGKAEREIEEKLLLDSRGGAES